MNNADKSQESKADKHDYKKGGLLGKPGTFSRKANVGCLLIIIPFFIVVGWSGYNTTMSMRLRAKCNIVENDLRSVLTACEKYWETNPKNDCSLPASKQEQLDLGLNSDTVKVSIVNGKKGRFIATAKHYQIDKIFQIDNSGDIYIKVNDCLLKNRTEWIEASNEEIEEKCKKQKLAEERQAAEREHIKKELEKK